MFAYQTDDPDHLGSSDSEYEDDSEVDTSDVEYICEVSAAAVVIQSVQKILAPIVVVPPVVVPVVAPVVLAPVQPVLPLVLPAVTQPTDPSNTTAYSQAEGNFPR